MQIAGEASVEATPQQVFAALQNPGALQRSLPGCEGLTPEEDGYRANFTIGVAAVRGKFAGRITPTSAIAAERYDFTLSLEGSSGFFEASVETRLAPTGSGTRLSYQAEAEFGGMLASLGQRVAGGVAAVLVRQFCEALGREAKAL